ncbi:MAG TPA: hydrogenase maturation protease [Syntrophales bacterium]|jgi:hydrogenase maturation protease|nr:hydrogenase maturation protease [Syntrophales bacterium]HPX56448.1 hydrogenase maturation protease [Syntrophales bacterium]HQA83246.1 hydrogenase maturation protease [Syntrophales bacterium]
MSDHQEKPISRKGGESNSPPFPCSGNRKYVTVLGLGNILMGDEGFGVHFIRWFSNRYDVPGNVLLVDGGTLGYVLLDTICSCEHLIVIDVLKIDDTPGHIYRFSKEEMEIHLPPPTSAHEVKFADVMCKADMLGEMPETTFLCIVPDQYKDLNPEMTSILKEKFPVLEDFLLQELAHLGIVPEKTAHA